MRSLTQVHDSRLLRENFLEGLDDFQRFSIFFQSMFRLRPPYQGAATLLPSKGVVFLTPLTSGSQCRT